MIKSQNSSDRNEATYRRLKDTIARTYPTGQFVAIADDRVMANGQRLDDLLAVLRELGMEPRQTLIVQAGIDYPDYVCILMPGTNR